MKIRFISIFPMNLVEISRISQAANVTATDIVNYFGGISLYAKLRNNLAKQNVVLN